MAYRRSLSTRATLIARACNNPSFSYIRRDHHHRHNRDSTLSRREIHNFIKQRSSFGRVSHFSLGSAFVRYMSTSVGEGGGSDNTIELIMSDVTDVVSDANEVAIAAAVDSFWPVTVLQHFIDSVHNFTGLNWWASIVLATLLCRCAIYPLVIYEQQLESMKLYVTFKHFKEMLEDKDMDPKALADGHKQMQKAHECCVLPQISVLIDGTFTISSLLEISKMVEKLPSFKSGGVFWFTDLTTPDSFYILPILIGLSFSISAEVTMQEFMKDDDFMKIISICVAVLLVSATMDCPKAIRCYLITSNLVPLAYVQAGLFVEVG